MLAHPNVKVLLNADYRDVRDIVPHREVVYTGPVDEFFDYRYGKLPYRSLQFRFETVDSSVVQPVAVLNYPNEHAYTRVTEFKYLTGQQHAKSTLVTEYPQAEGDPYYPVPRPENAKLYKRYKALADATPGVHFVGRLATYKYYNMDQVVAQALATFDRIVGRRCVPTRAAASDALVAVAAPLWSQNGNGQSRPANGVGATNDVHHVDLPPRASTPVEG
jgi:UDP-galactopyranose mutase